LLDSSTRQPIAERIVLVRPGDVQVGDRHMRAQPATLQVTWLVHPDVPAADPTSMMTVSVRSQGVETQYPVDSHVGDSSDVRGWFSPTYGARQATTATRVRVADVDAATTIVSRINSRQSQ